MMIRLALIPTVNDFTEVTDYVYISEVLILTTVV